MNQVLSAVPVIIGRRINQLSASTDAERIVLIVFGIALALAAVLIAWRRSRG